MILLSPLCHHQEFTWVVYREGEAARWPRRLPELVLEVGRIRVLCGDPPAIFCLSPLKSKKFESRCFCFPLFQSYCLIFRWPASREVFINTPWGKPKTLLRVFLTVAESNVVCVLSCGREQCGLRCLSSSTREKLTNTNTSRNTGCFCFKRRTLLHALFRFSPNIVTILPAWLWRTESSSLPYLLGEQYVPLFLLRQTLVLINRALLFWVPLISVCFLAIQSYSPAS